MVELLIDLINLYGLDLVLLLPYDLAANFVIDLVDSVADSEVDFPEDTLDECAHNGHQYEVHKDEENDYACIKIGIPPAVIVSDGGPAGLR